MMLTMIKAHHPVAVVLVVACTVMIIIMLIVEIDTHPTHIKTALVMVIMIFISPNHLLLNLSMFRIK